MGNDQQNDRHFPHPSQPGYWGRLIFLSAFCTLLLVFEILCCVDWHDYSRRQSILKREGVATRAMVVEITGRGVFPTVEYADQVGRTYRYKPRISTRCREGDILPVTYAQSNPDIVLIDGIGRGVFPFAFLFITFWLLLLGWCLLGLIRHGLRCRASRQDGKHSATDSANEHRGLIFAQPFVEEKHYDGWLLLIAAIAFFSAGCGDSTPKQDGKGIDLFIEACRHYGDNPTLIKSMYVEIEQKKPALKNSDRQEEESKSRRRLLLRADSSLHHKTKSEIRSWDSREKKWEDGEVIVQSRMDKQKGEQSFNVHSQHNGHEIAIADFNWHVPPCQTFGRVYGISAFAAVVNLTQGETDYSRFEFTPKNIRDYKKMLADQEKEHRQVLYVITGEATYDRDGKAVVLESYHRGKVFERYWIDPSRGYICPLYQLLNPKTRKPVEEQKADRFFLHDESGLWYPAEYSKTNYDAETGEAVEREEFRIDPKTFRLNRPVGDDDFYIEVAERAWISDARNEKRSSYRAVKPGRLTLAEDGLDLENKDWLLRGNDLPAVPCQPKP